MNEPERQPTDYARKIYSLLTLIVVLWIAWHPVHAELVRNSPPASCLLGGTWNLWSGWTCG